MNYKRLAPLFVILAGSCWGVIGVFSRGLSAGGFTSIQTTASRCIVTAALLLIFLLIKDRSKLHISLPDIWIFIGTGVCSILFFNICFFITVSATTLSLASILLYTAPCFVVLISAPLFHEKITIQKAAALILAFGGCVLTTGVIGGSTQITGLGVLTGIGAGFGYGLYSIFGRIALRKYHPLTVTAYTFIVAAVVIMPFCNIGDICSRILAEPTLLTPVFFLAALCTLAPFLLYTKALENMETGKASVMAFVEPMVATLAGFLLFGEILNIKNIAGITLIFISVVLLNINFNSKTAQNA